MPPETTEEPTTKRASLAELTRTHKVLIAVVIVGAVIIAGIGFAGSYAAVRELAVTKGFGNFSYVLPVGIDAGICVLLALDLLLTWIRIPFPLLRQTAWLLTAATIAFNGAAAWPDPLGVGMHAVIPVLFVVSVEAARHAIGRISDITADKHMEGVRLSRWLLSPIPTFLLWRRMKLWELRSYEQVIRLEQDRYVYQTWLESQFGKKWRRAARNGRKGGPPVELLMPLRLARYGKPLTETVPAVLTATGYEVPALFQPRELLASSEPETAPEAEVEAAETSWEPDPEPEHLVAEETRPTVEPEPVPEPVAVPVADWQQEATQATHAPYTEPVPQPETYGHERPFQGPGMVYEQPSVPEPYAQPVPEPVAETLSRPEPVAAAPARSTSPKRVEAKVEDRTEEEAPARAGRGANTRARVAEIYRNLSEEDRALRGRPLARVISEASNGELKFDTVKRSHISEELLAEYLQSAPQIPVPREKTLSEDVR